MLKLDAVNMALRALGESPVTTLSAPTDQDVISAIAQLDLETTKVQMSQHSFNVDRVALTPAAITYYVTLGTGALGLAKCLTDEQEYMLTKGNTLCIPSDYPNPTAFTGASTITVSCIMLRTFELLPEHAAQYIANRAAYRLVDDSLSDSGKSNSWANNLREAREQFRKIETKTNRKSFLRT